MEIKYNVFTDKWELWINNKLIYSNYCIYNVFARSGYSLE